MGRSRIGRQLTWFVFGTLAVQLLPTLSRAGTIRDDRADSFYTALAEMPQFAASGYLRIFNGASFLGSASATLVDPHWVLTSAHCVIDENGATGTSWTFQIGGQIVTVPPEHVYVPAAYITSGFDSGHDLALLRLPTPIRGVRPAAISTFQDEVGKLITTVGYGSTGDGGSGNNLAPGTRRAGQNVVDATSAVIAVPGYRTPPVPVGNALTLLCDFDSPQRGRSTIGSAIPLHLEYSAAPGDSGGGAFLMAGGGSRIIGVVSGGIRPNGLRDGSYGTTFIYTRVSQHVGWIRSVLGGREMPLPTLIAQARQDTLQQAAEIFRRRAVAYANNGYHVTRYIARSAALPETIQSSFFLRKIDREALTPPAVPVGSAPECPSGVCLGR